MHVTSYNNTINEDIFALYNVDIMAILEPNAKTICVEGLGLRLHNGYKYLCSLHLLYADRKVSSACDLSGGRSADPGLSHVEAALRGDYKQLQNNTVQKHEGELYTQHMHDSFHWSLANILSCMELHFELHFGYLQRMENYDVISIAN